MTFDLEHWSAHERRYDGPNPPDQLSEATFSLHHANRLERAKGLRLMWGSAVRRQIRRIRKARQIAFINDRGRKTGLSENHHAGGRLQQMRAGARADHEEECILNPPVQPYDTGQPTKYFPLAALAQHRSIFAAGFFGNGCDMIHDIWLTAAGTCSNRAARSFIRNCPALMM